VGAVFTFVGFAFVVVGGFFVFAAVVFRVAMGARREPKRGASATSHSAQGGAHHPLQVVAKHGCPGRLTLVQHATQPFMEKSLVLMKACRLRALQGSRGE
jgi:hypothetical protein